MQKDLRTIGTHYIAFKLLSIFSPKKKKKVIKFILIGLEQTNLMPLAHCTTSPIKLVNEINKDFRNFK